MSCEAGAQPLRREIDFDGFLIDLDGTLVDSTAAIVHHWAE